MHPSDFQTPNDHPTNQLFFLLSFSNPTSLRLGQLKQGDCLTEIRPVHTIRHDVGTFVTDHELTPFRAQSPKVDVGGIVDVDHSFLTALGAQAGLRVPVLEEIVQPTAVHEDGTGIQDPKTPSPGAIRRRAVRVGGIVPAALRCEVGVEGVRVALVIRRLMLNVTHEDVFRVGKLVVVHDAVLGSSAVQPHRPFCRFKEEATVCSGQDEEKHNIIGGNPPNKLTPC